MNQKEKDLISSILRINYGIYVIFLGFSLVALNDYYWSLNFLQNSVMMVIGMIIAAFIIISGVSGFNRQKAELKTDGKMRIIKYLELVPNVLGFALLGIGAYLLSFYESQSIMTPEGNSHIFFVHPYSSQSSTLFLVGTGIEFLAWLLYYYLIPMQMVKETKV